MNIKQDINMTRKPVELEQKYRLGEIKTTKKRVDELEEEKVIDTSLSSTSSNAVANYVITEALSTKINAVSGKTLTTNDFTDSYKNKLDGIEENANNYTLPIDSVFFSVSQVDDASLSFIGTLIIGSETVYCYKKIN